MTATAADWLDACTRLAKAAQQPNETFEASFARTVSQGAGAAFLAMHRQPQGRMPAQVSVVYKGTAPASAEAKLHRLAVEAASTSKESYEQAMSRILATPEGQTLWQATRDESKARPCHD